MGTTSSDTDDDEQRTNPVVRRLSPAEAEALTETEAGDGGRRTWPWPWCRFPTLEGVVIVIVARFLISDYGTLASRLISRLG